MAFITYAYLAYAMYSTNKANALGEAQRLHQQGLQSDAILANVEQQRRQLDHSTRAGALTHERSLDGAYWPLTISPTSLLKRFEKDDRRPLLVMFVPPAMMAAGPRTEKYQSALKTFARDRLGGALGGVSFQTGFWKAAIDLTDGAIAQLQCELPDQPMLLLSFALLPGDHVEPRVAYLPGIPGPRAEVLPLATSPLPIGTLMRDGERAASREIAHLTEDLLRLGFTPSEVTILVGPEALANGLVGRVERALQEQDKNHPAISHVADLYRYGEAGQDEAQATLISVLQLALLLAADGHNFAARGLPPRLPNLIDAIRDTLPVQAAGFIASALEAHRRIMVGIGARRNAPNSASHLFIPAIESERHHSEMLVKVLGDWARTHKIDPQESVEHGVDLLARHASVSDAIFVERVGIYAEESGDHQSATRCYTLAQDLRRRRGKPHNNSTGEAQ